MVVRKVSSKGLALRPKVLQKATRSLIRVRRILLIRMDMILSPREMKVSCPCCNMKYRSFKKGNYLEHPERFNRERYLNTRQDVHCPFCGSLPRHRILALWCEEHKNLLRSSKILYFSSENSMTLWMKRNRIKYTSADLYKKRDLKLDIQNTDLEDNSYDIVIANHVLEHVDDFRKALREMKRILKPGGSFICSFPMDPKVELLDEEEEPLPSEERIKRFGQNDHKRVFGMKADQFLTEVGFEVELIRGEDYPDEILPVVGPADYDMNILFCCRKPA